MDLYEWTKHYIKFKDVMKRQIKDIKFLNTSIFVTEKKGTKEYFVFEDLSEGIEALKKTKEEEVYIVTLNLKKNSEILVKQWEELIKRNKLTIIFAHPGTNEKWIIHPKTHNSITEKTNLASGIQTLYESITPV